DHGDIITHHWIEELLDEEFSRLERFDGDRFEDARDIFEEVTLSKDFPSFLTLPAYTRYLSESGQKASDEDLALA
ncbi:malate synthase A, partial [bacterium RCC_150]